MYDGVDVIYMKTYRVCRFGKNSFGLLISPDLVRFCGRELANYDVVHLDGYRGLDVLVTARFCRKYGVPYVIQGRGTMRPTSSSVLAKRTYDWLLGGRDRAGCALFIASSGQEVSDYDGFIGHDQRVTVIYNGLDLSEYAPLPARGSFRQRHGIDEPKVVTYLGRLHPQKGIEYLVRAFVSSRFRRESRLVIVGPDEGHKTELAAVAKGLGLADSVAFIDTLEGEEKLQAYVDSDVVVYAGRSESFGMVPFEAAMCGVPAITSEGSACGELLKKFGAGFLVPYGDSQKLALAIDGILTDGKEAAARVRAARESIKTDLSWRKIAEEYEAAYSSVLRVR
jgi:glycosyltransferase involved in cell wall biosynthesis